MMVGTLAEQEAATVLEILDRLRMGEVVVFPALKPSGTALPRCRLEKGSLLAVKRALSLLSSEARTSAEMLSRTVSSPYFEGSRRHRHRSNSCLRPYS